MSLNSHNAVKYNELLSWLIFAVRYETARDLHLTLHQLIIGHLRKYSINPFIWVYYVGNEPITG